MATISVDFDATIFEEWYPEVGPILPGAKETINWLWGNDHTIIIDTCRTGGYAEDAVQALRDHDIKYDFFNQNDPKRIEKYGGDSRKISTDIDIDDKSIDRMFCGGIDWKKIRLQLELLLDRRKIVCIVGESGTGKTYLAEYLREKHGVPMIESYTDRPQRSPNEVGHTFLSKDEFDELDMRDMIAFTARPDGHGGVTRYCCMLDDVKEKVMSYVIDERGLRYFKKHWSHLFTIFAVRMFADDSLRKERISIERLRRDEGEFVMGEDQFDCFINNDYTENMCDRYDQLYAKISSL